MRASAFGRQATDSSGEMKGRILANNGQNVIFFEHQVLFIIQFELCAAILGEQDAITFANIHCCTVAIIQQATTTNSDPSLFLIEVVNHTCDVNRTILRIITVAGTASSTTGAAIGFSLYDCRRPENFNIAVRTAERLLLNAMWKLTIVKLGVITLYIHVLLPQTHC